MERRFDEELKIIKNRVLYMGGMVEQMIHLALKELMERKPDLAQEVATCEKEVNQLHKETDENCIRLLALFQPEAVDLRFITVAMKIISDLERIGDQAVNISQTSLIMLEQPQLREKLSNISVMTQHTLAMLKDSLDAYVNHDVELARRILENDDREDELKAEIFDEMLKLMTKETSCIPQALEMILISRNLERIGDHATNIAEDVIYMVSGEDIRHTREAKG